MSMHRSDRYLPPRRVALVGHRGVSPAAGAPENTLAAFRAALDYGVDAVELDVHLSRDSELVVIHDPTLERTTDGAGRVGDLSLAQLRQLDAAAKYLGPNKPGVQRLPTLEEAVDLVAGRVPMHVEIKQRYDGSRYPKIERKVLDSLRRKNACGWVSVSSFDFDTVQEVQRLEPKLAAYGIVSRAFFLNVGGKGPSEVVEVLRGRGLAWVAVNRQYLTQPLFDALKGAGMQITVWVIDDEEEMWKFVAMGVDSITTNRADLLVPAYRRGTAHR